MQGILEKLKNKQTQGYVALVVLLVAFIVVRCTPLLYYINITGEWYQEDSRGEWAFTLYSDRTCEIDNEYGIGTWAIVNGNHLKLTNNYGETETAKIVSVSARRLVLENGRGDKIVYWSSKGMAQLFGH